MIVCSQQTWRHFSSQVKLSYSACPQQQMRCCWSLRCRVYSCSVISPFGNVPYYRNLWRWLGTNKRKNQSLVSAKFSQRLNWIHHETQQHLANIDQMPMSRRHLPIEQMLPILCLSYVSSIHWAKICRMFMRWLGCKLWLMYSSVQVAQITAITANDYAVKLMHLNARWTFALLLCINSNNDC